jgi:hypothetical protein
MDQPSLKNTRFPSQEVSSMDLGFETCGNATLIVYDAGVPLLVTDPWIAGAQYFGSWALPYRFTAQQAEAFPKARYAWLSHGHPDHLNLQSLESLRNSTLLVPTHRGSRIATDLKQAGFKVTELADGQWVSLSDRVRIMCYPDWNQDAALLISVGTQCAILNLNDGTALAHRARLKQLLAGFRRRFVLRLTNYGDADMINYFTESGERIMPMIANKKPLGLDYSALLKDWGGTHTAPFSCHHRYARTDSQWAAICETPLEDHGNGFNSARGEFIPGYFSYDVDRDCVTQTAVERVPVVYREPREFGDDWSEPLGAEDVPALNAYFGKFDHLKKHFEFINCRVGGKDNFVALGGPEGRGITFEAPRNSLMTAVRYEIFDDLLIGNFMKTTLHGGVRSLYPDFSPYVAKYGDNGRAFSKSELDAYFAAYRSTMTLQAWADHIKANSSRRLRLALSANQTLYLAARSVYRRLRS